MSQQKLHKVEREGFTIIEVVLVLAIAGLIFLMVFVALPALQRSQRDTARRNDMSRVDTSLIQYQTNNQDTGNGDLPYSKTTKENQWTASTDGTFGANGCGTNVACKFIQRYMNSGTDSDVNNFKDPDGAYYSLKIGKGALDTSTNADFKSLSHVIYIQIAAKCNGENAVATTDSPRHFAVLYRLEGAGTYCIDDQ